MVYRLITFRDVGRTPDELLRVVIINSSSLFCLVGISYHKPDQICSGKGADKGFFAKMIGFMKLSESNKVQSTSGGS